MVDVQPWNSHTLIWSGAISDAWYKGGALLSKLKETYDLSDAKDVQIRTHRISAWGSMTAEEPIGMEILSATGTSTGEPDVQKTIRDAPGRNHRAVVTHRWTPAERKQPRNFRGQGADEYVFGISGPVDQIYIDISWKVAEFSTTARTIVG